MATPIVTGFPAADPTLTIQLPTGGPIQLLKAKVAGMRLTQISFGKYSMGKVGKEKAVGKPQLYRFNDPDLSYIMDSLPSLFQWDI